MVPAGPARIALGDFFGKYAGKPVAWRTFPDVAGRALGARRGFTSLGYGLEKVPDFSVMSVDTNKHHINGGLAGIIKIIEITPPGRKTNGLTSAIQNAGYFCTYTP